ncbi:small secreted hydrophilic protein [Streptomyces albipurpureus]|uniref:Small secreted hydrophilic protein n=1 Tax=Streptomyces albipurpureus TaxID=2897419 RepID=A0ABT0UV69_9ACTN|nr:small secreted hydrophilic protein [Streptomyces sp. CWNU-1]MCM2392473.1 small secreted hydrophilic protein [Streptomyces sp. CWNU-1]
MVFSHRLATLAAVVAIPLGIAVTSYALTDNPDDRKAPPKVELESGSPSPSPSTPVPAPSNETVSPPPIRDSPSGDDNNDDGNERGGQGDDGPGGDDTGEDG